MTNHEKVANVIAFFAIMLGEHSASWAEVMKLDPNYIIEKFERYVLAIDVEYPWGLHPLLRNQRFHAYTDKWALQL